MNSNSSALNFSRESTMKVGRSGVGLEVPPLRSENQNGFSGLMTHQVNRADHVKADNFWGPRPAARERSIPLHRDYQNSSHLELEAK